MDVLGYLRLVRRHWWIVLVTVMLGLGAAALVTVRTPPRYEASVTSSSPRPARGHRRLPGRTLPPAAGEVLR
ncbi:Wzz/FepE/Etk N-terminal domain-containing protein [Micromonospora sp. BRA006-A]|nr:Wzz/FepE/Etk N-terminal domain-containing protein [Micromonospora sp. BRA006-A]